MRVRKINKMKKLYILISGLLSVNLVLAQSGPRFAPRPQNATPPADTFNPQTPSGTPSPLPFAQNQPMPNYIPPGTPYTGQPGISPEMAKPEEEIIVKKLGKVNGKHLYKAENSNIIFIVKKESEIHGKRVPVIRSSGMNSVTDPNITSHNGAFEDASKRKELPSMVGTAGPR